jgi:hypothetical protein
MPKCGQQILHFNAILARHDCVAGIETEIEYDSQGKNIQLFLLPSTAAPVLVALKQSWTPKIESRSDHITSVIMRFLTACSFLLSLASAATLKARAPTPGTLSQVTGVGPTTAAFYIYVPKNLATTPGIVVAIHYCTGTAQAYYNNSPYKTLSEQYGFIVIYPSSPHSGTCWDVSSKATLSHEGGGDSNTIANMVKWTIKEYSADPSKVFATGTSSGAMMTVSFQHYPRPHCSIPNTKT